MMMDIDLPPTTIRQPLPLEPLDPAELQVLLTREQDSTDMKKPWTEGTSSGSTDGGDIRTCDTREHGGRPYSIPDQQGRRQRRPPNGKSSISSRGAPSDSSRPYSVLDVSKWQGSSGDTRTEVVDMLRKLQVEVDTLREFLDERKRVRDSGIYESIETKTDPRNPKRTRGDTLLRYASNMGLHRLRYIIDAKNGPFRSFIWVLLFLGCIGLASYQIQDRVRIFLSYASDTTVETRYVDTLQFPAVTICNLNEYRLTPTAKNGLYDVLHTFVHGRGSHQKAGNVEQRLKDVHLSYANFLISSAHQKEKLVYRCRFRGKKCTAENFEPTFTDHGLCYTFTLKEERNGAIKKAGPESGLSLLLNVEQYEYLLGPKSAVGVKVAVHDPGILPSMRTDSLHASVGSRSSLAISKIEYSDLPPPYGECSDRDTGTSSSDEPRKPCELQCEAKYAMDICNCTLPFGIDRHAGRPPCPRGRTAEDGYLPKCADTKAPCTLANVFLCTGKAAGTPRNSHNCTCLPPCDRTEYDIQLSHAMMSAYSAESEVRVLDEHDILEEEFRSARDIYQRLDEEIYKYDCSILTNLSQGLEANLHYMKKLEQDMDSYDSGFDRDLVKMRNALNSLNATVQVTASQFIKSSHVAFLTFAHQLLPPLEEISTYHDFADNLHAHQPQLIRKKLEEIMEILETLIITTSSTAVTSEIIKGVQSFQEELLEGYGQKYSEFRHSKVYYELTTRSILNFTNYIKDTLWEQYRFIKNVTKRTDFPFTLVKRKLNDFFRIIQHLQTKDVPDLEKKLDEFFKYYVSHRSTVNDLITQLNELGTEFTVASEVVQASSLQLRTSLGVLQAWLQEVYTTVTELMRGYERRTFFKTAMALRLNSEAVKAPLKEAEESLEMIKVSSEEALEQLLKLVKKMKPIAPRFVDFNLDEAEYLYQRLQSFEPPSLQKEAEVLSTALTDNLILIKQYQAELKEYLDTNKLDGDFFLNNFLQLEVYFQDLSETLMSQQSPYGLIDLACDVGGTMALYLGASLLTIFELLDFITKAMNVCMRRSAPRKQPRSSEPALST